MVMMPACTLINCQGRYVRKVRLDFIHGVIPHCATARETLDVYYSGSLRGFVLVCARGLILGLMLELIQFPIF